MRCRLARWLARRTDEDAASRGRDAFVILHDNKLMPLVLRVRIIRSNCSIAAWQGKHSACYAKRHHEPRNANLQPFEMARARRERSRSAAVHGQRHRGRRRVLPHRRRRRRILDLAAGQFCSILGHNHPKFVARLQEQAAKLVHLGDQYLSPEVMSAASRLAGIAPGDLKKVVLLSTGSEANECAMRMAKAVTGRTGMLGFHARLLRNLARDAQSELDLGSSGQVRFPAGPDQPVQAPDADVQPIARYRNSTRRATSPVSMLRWSSSRNTSKTSRRSSSSRLFPRGA